MSKKTKPKLKIKKRWWLTRDNTDYGPDYAIFYGQRPAKDGAYYTTQDSKPIAELIRPECAHKLFGVRLRPGQCREIKAGSLKLAAPGNATK